MFLFVPGVQQGGDLDVLQEEDSDKISTDGVPAGKILSTQGETIANIEKG